jgi:aspartyl-tRNA(Asn)/glutamyl-tRNA(Gln) amidotransferase subunit A
MYLGDIYTLAVNLAGLPAINAPVGFDKDNLPVGLQLIGNYWSESQLFRLCINTNKYRLAYQRAAIAEENA